LVQAYPAGGGLDPVARILATELEKKIGQQVVMEYRTGASGTIGTAFTAKAPADGYTIIISPNGPLINARYLVKDLSYDGFKDLTPITNVAESPLVILVNTKKLQVKTLPELIAYAKANPETVTAGNTGVNGSGHLAGLLLEQSSGIKLRHVPYRGTGQMMADLVGGQIDISINWFSGFGPHVDSGALRVISVLGNNNIPDQLKAFPTSTQQGVPFFASGYFALLAPKDLPKDLVNKINETVVSVLKTDAVKAKFQELGMAPAPTTPADLEKFLVDEDTRLAELIKKVGLKPE
jgi:tripartite-type tricarboxylate transporter receptor subunit TctC